MVTRSEPDYVWDFCGGELSIDFTNTIGNRGAALQEHIATFGDLLSWAAARGVIDRSQSKRLARDAARRPSAAVRALTEARALREALYRSIIAAATGSTLAGADLAVINAHVASSFSGARLQPAGDGLQLTFTAPGSTSGLAEAILTPVVRAAVELLTSDARSRVRVCADPSCAWLFLDTTRNRTRRWCDMKECGNRNKVRRFREAQSS